MPALAGYAERCAANGHTVSQRIWGAALREQMGKQQRKSKIELARRSYVEERERQLDLAECYERELAAATTPEERQRISNAFAAKRRAYREAEAKAGRRGPSVSVVMHQIMWARWIEVAVEQELKALEAFTLMLQGEQRPITDEFRASLLSLTASAYTIEALYGDIKYLIPPQPSMGKRHQTLSQAFRLAFGMGERDFLELASEMRWLFERRDMAVHPYTEAVLPKRHPAGFNTGAEHADFNALTSGRAVDVAMRVLDAAATPPKAYNHWIERWPKIRAAYTTNVVRPLQSQRYEARLRVPNGLKSDES
jgi:hypothetical protein